MPDAQYAIFHLLKAAEGGRSFAATRQCLDANGVPDALRDHSPYVGHYAVKVPKRFHKRARRILFGRA